MKHIQIQYYKSPVGEMILGAYAGKLCMADWHYRKMRKSIDNRLQQGLKAEYIVQDAPVLEETRQQLSEYFHCQRTCFALPLLMVGTDFQKQVWRALQGVAYGKTMSYQQLSKYIGNEKAVRAVASANGANAISIIIHVIEFLARMARLWGMLVVCLPKESFWF
jgi:methylated-DNA-[protein]-cysteine S-methyltransferase